MRASRGVIFGLAIILTVSILILYRSHMERKQELARLASQTEELASLLSSQEYEKAISLSDTISANRYASEETRQAVSKMRQEAIARVDELRLAELASLFRAGKYSDAVALCDAVLARGYTAEETRRAVSETRKQALDRLNEAKVGEYYSEAAGAFKKGEYDRALALVQKALSINANHEPSRTLQKQAQARKEKAEADKLWADAKAAVKGGHISTAQTLLSRLNFTNPNYPGVSKALSRLQWHKLCYYTGSGIMVSIPYVKQTGSTVVFYISVLNRTDQVHHVNPNNVTIEDAGRRSYSHSSKTYSYSNYLDAVDIRPGAQAGGYIRFDNVSAPVKRVYYQGLFGGEVSVELPDFKGSIDINTHDIKVFD